MRFSRHQTRKRFGQHWLKDESILTKIVAAADLKSNDRVLEIGPGKGALTEKLLALNFESLHTIELDRDLVTGLKDRFGQNPRFSLREGDALFVPLTPPRVLPANKVVANIPYNITGPLLERLVGRLDKPTENIYERLVILLQKEVANRILASPGQSNYSALSVRMQLMANCRNVCVVPPKCFQPPPKVYSQVIIIEPLSLDKRIDLGIARQVEILLKTAYLARRKMLHNTLRNLPYFSQIDILANNFGIDLEQRPQDLSPEDWLNLAKGLSDNNLINSKKTE
tara:strand:+ start:394 stop:1242 length:849 start_codon:yes stop_codon:yes gene_type:complete